MTHNKNTSGFKAAGFYPLHPQDISETTFAPSLLILAEATSAADCSDTEISEPRVHTRPCSHW